MVRGADRLDPLPDGVLCERDLEYLQRHGVGPLLNGLVLALAKAAPPDPLQFLIDSLTLGHEGAEQASMRRRRRRQRTLNTGGRRAARAVRQQGWMGRPSSVAGPLAGWRGAEHSAGHRAARRATAHPPCPPNQNPETGLPRHRQAKLEKVFRVIDRSSTGRMSMRALQVCACMLTPWAGAIAAAAAGAGSAPLRVSNSWSSRQAWVTPWPHPNTCPGLCKQPRRRDPD
jgi:hypothetical protein